jgi:hypothetical protein
LNGTPTFRAAPGYNGKTAAIAASSRQRRRQFIIAGVGSSLRYGPDELA